MIIGTFFCLGIIFFLITKIIHVYCGKLRKFWKTIDNIKSSPREISTIIFHYIILPSSFFFRVYLCTYLGGGNLFPFRYILFSRERIYFFHCEYFSNLEKNIQTGKFWYLTLIQQNKHINRLSKLIVLLPWWLPPFVCTTISCVQTPISSPLSLCSAGFPSNWHGKRALIQAASGGVNFLQSHFILCIAAMPGVQVDCVKGSSRISPFTLEECTSLQWTAQRCLFGKVSSWYVEKKCRA